ncbi:MAG: hypothetical protein RMH97_04930 [Verrucomicrobiales bacterium]|nr:hypothetical protein [Verrucomicrobiales bacterium]
MHIKLRASACRDESNLFAIRFEECAQARPKGLNLRATECIFLA